MDKRFILSAAGASAAAIGAMSAAEVVNVTFNYDYYYSEDSFQILNSASQIIASEISWGGVAGASSLGYLGSSYGAPNSSMAYAWTGVNMDLASGTYTVRMQDSYGDGWSDAQWGGQVNGANASWGPHGSVHAFTSTMGGSTSYSFIIVPTPGALSLLGLAGVAGVQRRRK